MAKPPPTPKRKPHDMGGDPAGPVDREEHTPSMTERRIDAMMQLLRAKPRAFWVTDENRRTIESLSPDTYRDSRYYEKWCYAMRSLLVEKGVLTEDEISTRLGEVKTRYAVSAKATPKPVRATAKASPAKPVATAATSRKGKAP
ncbi:MAG: nitrile hydratase subunit beta [Hyphomicrobiaceae bacterium]|nr:nitrile hydratase subunit beta [Hyphomicrobiaceae bacterium]